MNQQITNNWLNFTIALVFFLLGLIILAGLYLWGQVATREKNQKESITGKPIEGSLQTQTSSAGEPAVASFDPAPVYLTTYEGNDALFVHNSNFYKECSSEQKISNQVGKIVYGNSAGGYTVLEDRLFTQLENPQKVFMLSKKICTISPLVSDSRDILYISLDTDLDNIDLISRIYQVNLPDLSYREIWSHETKDAKRYGLNGGGRAIQNFEDKYIAIIIGACTFCDDPTSIISLYNIESQKEKILGDVGDIAVNVENNTVTYREMGYVKEKCTPDPTDVYMTCQNGYRYVYQPIDPTITDTLP